MALFDLFKRDSSLPSGTATPTEWLISLIGGGKSKAGQPVNVKTSMSVVAVYRCVTVISGSIAYMPTNVYRRVSDGVRERATDHPLYQLLRRRPNAYTSAFRWKQSMVANILLRGNAYAVIDRDGSDTITALHQIDADRVRVSQLSGGELVYHITGIDTPYPARRILHLRNTTTLNGVLGISPIACCRESLGITLAAESTGAEAFGQGIVPPAVLSVKGRPDKEARDKVREGWRETFAGNRSDVAVLGDEATLTPLSINLEDMQLLETRKFQIMEIARMFGVPPSTLFELDSITYNNHEQLKIAHLVQDLGPRLASIEQDMMLALLSDAEAEDLYIEHDTNPLLRMDAKTRWEIYKTEHQLGVSSANDIRRAENRRPIDSAGGDDYFVPANLRPLSTPYTPGANGANGANGAADQPEKETNA